MLRCRWPSPRRRRRPPLRTYDAGWPAWVRRLPLRSSQRRRWESGRRMRVMGSWCLLRGGAEVRR
ncbi:hypothetical protein ACFFX0_13905 [Citricoccus parietis]|uniref:Uncharacterized protein n=1 Tax=Citricoccus parietis TaxID=592307 RepID=A0ABV5FZX7_9MICC